MGGILQISNQIYFLVSFGGLRALKNLNLLRKNFKIPFEIKKQEIRFKFALKMFAKSG